MRIPSIPFLPKINFFKRKISDFIIHANGRPLGPSSDDHECLLWLLFLSHFMSREISIFIPKEAKNILNLYI